jgi:hypothetical protein
MSQATYEPIAPGVSAETVLQHRQQVRQQTEGVGLRVGNKSEFTFICSVVPGGAKLFRERREKAQTEAGYWEGQIGTVHDLRIAFFENDTRFLFAATYSEDFKPYVADVIKFATPWFDFMFTGVLEGFPGLGSPDVAEWLNKYTLQADLWYASNPDLSVRDVAKAERVLNIFNELLDVAQG